MNNCKNCKHWAFDEDSGYQKPEEIKKCKRIKMFWDSTDWDEKRDSRIFLDDSKAFVQDASDYYAELLTKSEFYCNMWESK